MNRFAGRWHLLAIFACCSAWLIEGKGIIRILPLLLIACFGLYLYHRREFVLLTGVGLLLLIIIADGFLFQERDTILHEGHIRLSGTINDIPLIDGDQLTETLKTTAGEPVKIIVKLRSENEKSRLARELKPGMISQVSGTLERPPLPGNFHAFNYRAYLASHHIYWQLKTDDSPTFADPHPTLLDYLKRFRQHETVQINNRFSQTSAEMINSLIFGDDQNMDPDLSGAYQYLGLVHLLVVSGMHIVVVFGTLFYLARRLGMAREHAESLFLILIPVYVVLTGAEPSIVRSGLTACLTLAAGLFGRRFFALADGLSLSCLIMVLCDLKVIFDLGFQLSFAVTFALIVSGPGLLAKYKSPLFRLFMAAVMSELASFPIVIFHFYRLSLLSFFLSVFYVPYLSFIILPFCFMIYFLSCVFPEISPFLSNSLDFSLSLPQQLLLMLYKNPVLQLNYGAMSFSMLLIAIFILIACLLCWEKTAGIRSTVWLLSPFFLIYALVSITSLLNPTGAVTFVNVGQGDSMLIQLPHQQGNLLIDTGGTLPYRQPAWMKKRKPYEVGRDTLLPELRAFRVNKLDTVVLTHRDYDHIGGFQALIGQIPIRRLIITPYFDPNASDLSLFKKAIQKGTKISLMKEGDSFRVGGHLFYILSPLTRAEDSNDNSLVIRTHLGGKNWLFTGDLSSEGERKIMAAHLNIRGDILKLGHHGSRLSTSASWLKKVKPVIGIVSCGKNNRYGHPNPEVLVRLKKAGTNVLRTDQSGDLRFEFRGDQVTAIETAR
ncbi:MAG: DNA internalization-related competence protein ComEC/Rec2 [Sporolactobacillus sp.]